MSMLWKALVGFFKTKLAMSTTKHPQMDGQTEVMNQALETMLQAYMANNWESWADWIDVLKFSYITAKHSTIGMSPVKALMGYSPNSPLALYAWDSLDPQTTTSRTDERITELIKHHNTMRDAIVKASN